MRNTTKRLAIGFSIALLCLSNFICMNAQETRKQVVDKVVWMVGDQPILLSDVEYQKLRMQSEGIKMDGNANCFIPEQLAVQMLFLNEAELDSVTVDQSLINRQVDAYLQSLVQQVGSKEKLEEYFGKPFSQIQEDQRRIARDGEIVNTMQSKLVKNVQVTPTEIRAFYNSIPADSLPYVPTKVEVQILVRKPEIRLTEIDRIKSKLRQITDAINKGETSFSTQARLYSEDTRTASNGGEYGFVAKSSLEPEFARIVFNMPSSQKVSPIIQTEEGYHIVQVIEKRGDVINFRHILLRPQVSNEALEKEVAKLDSIKNHIVNGKLTFSQAVEKYTSDDKTINNDGLMVNEDYRSQLAGSSEFTLEELPQDISRAINHLKVGEISQAFVAINDKGVRQVIIAKLYNKIPAHRANIQEDFQQIKKMALTKKKQEVIDSWIRNKQKSTYIYIDPEYRNCDFHYPNWVHKQ